MTEHDLRGQCGAPSQHRHKITNAAYRGDTVAPIAALASRMRQWRIGERRRVKSRLMHPIKPGNYSDCLVSVTS